MNTDILFSPMKIGTCEIKNRFVMSAMSMGFAGLDGKPTNQLINYYCERALGGTGLIITEAARINNSNGAGIYGQLSLSNDSDILPLNAFVKNIHKCGAKIFIQLYHPGRQTDGISIFSSAINIKAQEISKGKYERIIRSIKRNAYSDLTNQKFIPSSVAPSACKASNFSGGKVRALRHYEIKQLEENFVKSAIRAQKAGFDGIELNAAHGYLIQQFFSPVTNQRTDEYGGCFENRMRFITNIINAIRRECTKDFPIVVKLSVDECYTYIGEPERGYKLDEGIKIAKSLEKLGIDAIDISCGNYDTLNCWIEPVSFSPGWRKFMAKAVKDSVSIPVIAANLIRSPEQAAEQIAEGTQDFVALGRPHLAEPNIVNKIKNKQTIRRCISCLNCIESAKTNSSIVGHGECSVNPFIGHEKEQLRIDGHGKKIVVIGAGVAGLTAAYILALRGFDVSVFEKSNSPGGLLKLASASPHKEKTAWFIDDITKLCIENNVTVTYNTEVNVELIKKIKPYAVFCATGSKPLKPIFDGNYSFNDILTFNDILSGKVFLDNKKVAILGSGLTGLETAAYLNQCDNETIVIDSLEYPAPGTWTQHTDDILPRLKENGTIFLLGKSVYEINANRIILLDIKTKQKSEVLVDAIVFALGSQSENKLYEELKEEKISRVFVLGDADKVGKIQNATASAYKAAIGLI